MKIVSVDVMRVPAGNAGASRGDWCPVVVRINTDDGICGFGEAGLAYGKGWRGGYGMVQDFAEVIIGEDPTRIEKIWDTIFRKTFWGLGGGTVVNAAISALDIALWDIKGKLLGVPVWQLLGGKTNDKLRTYASQLQFNWGPNPEKQALITPDDYARATRAAIAEGYDCVKVDPVVFSDQADGKGPWRTTGPLENRVLRTVRDRMVAIRETGGPDLDIILEHHSHTDTVSAIQIGKAVEDLRIFYYEEPCHPLNPGNMLEVRNHVNIPIAAGERIYTRFGFRQFFEDRSIKIIQPDVCLCGGITEAKKICDMALTYDCTVQIHVCGSPVSTAAALQLEAVIPNFLIHEHHQRALAPEQRSTCLYDYQPVNGKYRVPDLPGIGQELTPETIARCETVTVTKLRRYLN